MLNLLTLIAASAQAHTGPDGGVHHFIDQLFNLWPFAMAAGAAAWAKLRR